MKISKKILTFLFYIFLIVNHNPKDAASSVYIDDLEKSIDLYSNEEYELSISILDDLIKSGGLDDVLLTRSFFYRGLSNYESNNYIAAITDITNSLWLDLLTDDEKIIALETRSLARSKIGQEELAIKDENSIEKLSKIDEIEEKLDAKNIEDIAVENKINNIKNRFSLNVDNFFGREEIEVPDIPDNNYVLRDTDLYNNILNFDSEDTSDISEGSKARDIVDLSAAQTIDPSKEKENRVLKQEDAERFEIIQNDNSEIKENVDRIYNEQVNYILISKGLDLSSAKVKINRVVNDNFRALSGIRPQLIEKIQNDGSKVFDIIIGPFANKSRMDKIAESLTKNNYSFTVESVK
tara:strand:- start:2251 stop:3306 length:1056 start_codon:yes stop_codon:yes gene_type:complete